MKITNITNRTRDIGVTGQVAGPGETIEVDDDIGKSLCEQEDRWKSAKKDETPKKPVADGKEKNR